MSRWRLDWPWPEGTPSGTARLKVCPEDFRVTEKLEVGGPVQELDGQCDIEVPGRGEHLLLYLEKTGDNTPWVAHRLGELAGCGDRGIGYSGLKDRHAVTRQWFSVQRPGLESGDADFIRALQQQWPVLAIARRDRKLRRGEHQANHFRIRLREVTGDPGELSQRLDTLAREGCPNYVGLQRFGHEGGNLERAVALAEKPARRRRRGRKASGNREGLYFSAARSWLFNEVLAERVEQGNWRDLLDGEPDPVPTGPLWGDGGTGAQGAQGALEREVVARHPQMEAVFADTRMAPERRALVLQPSGLDWTLSDVEEGACLDLSFTLSPGQYATTLLSSLVTLIASSGGQEPAEFS